MRLVRVHRHAYGPRVYVIGVRVHHGPAALAAAYILRHHRRARLIALAIAAHDARDFPFRDSDNHVPRRKVGHALST